MYSVVANTNAYFLKPYEAAALLEGKYRGEDLLSLFQCFACSISNVYFHWLVLWIHHYTAHLQPEWHGSVSI